MKKAYQVFKHIYGKYKVEVYLEKYYKTKAEAFEDVDKYTDDDEVIIVLPVYVTEKRYKWIFDEI